MYFYRPKRKLKLKTSSCNKKGKDFIPGSLELVKAVGGRNQKIDTIAGVYDFEGRFKPLA